ncbi:MAG: pyridoxine 5'-phosphate synthase [Maricaulaceae bacterium]
MRDKSDPNYLRLGVNIDHIATLRNARGEGHPDPVAGAWTAIQAGADGITAHLREDRRHISDDDIVRLQTLCSDSKIPLNMEMAVTDEMEEIASGLKPHAVCLVPERREERTTEGGLNVVASHNRITSLVSRLSEEGSRLSLFIEAVPEQIKMAARTGASVIELHAGAYAHAFEDDDQEKVARILKQLQDGAKLAVDLGLEVHAGHGLTFDNVAPIAAIPEVKELNIGHFIMGEAFFMGLEPAIKQMRNIMDDARHAAMSV